MKRKHWADMPGAKSLAAKIDASKRQKEATGCDPGVTITGEEEADAWNEFVYQTGLLPRPVRTSD